MVARMAGGMQAADAAGRLSALLSLLALRRLLAVLQPLALLLLLPFRWRARPAGAVAAAVASDAATASAPGASGRKGKASSSSSVVLRVPAGSPMVAARRQASARREIAVRRAREAGREYELVPTARGETLFTQCWWPHPPSSTVKPRWGQGHSLTEQSFTRLKSRHPGDAAHMCLQILPFLFS